MMPVTRRKLVYLSIVIGLPVVGLLAITHFRPNPLQILVAIAICLLPGRVLGFFWRDLLRGLRLLNAGQFEDSARHSRAFLQQLERRPWMKKLVWLSTSAYSLDAQAMALSNLGAAELKLGNLDVAETHLRASLQVDGGNPIPFFNLAQVFKLRGDMDRAQECLQEAANRGFTRGFTDRVVMGSQSRFAERDGFGRS